MTRERSQNNSGFGACFSSMSMQGQVYLWMAEVITTRKGCWRNCTTVPYDLVSYSSTNCSQNVWSSCAVTMNSECKHTHTPPQVLSNGMRSDTAGKADTEQLYLLNIPPCDHISQASLWFKGQTGCFSAASLSPWPLESLRSSPSQPWLTT